jgi:hypothetical protein
LICFSRSLRLLALHCTNVLPYRYSFCILVVIKYADDGIKARAKLP